VIDEIVSWLPITEEGSATVEDAIERLASPTGVLGLVSLALFFWAATGMMAALRNGLEAALQVEQGRPAARAKLIDLLLVVGAGVLLLAAIAINVVVQIVTRLVGNVADVIGIEGGVLSDLISFGVPLAIATIVAMLLYRFVPSRRLRFVDALAGGVVTGILLLAISAASAFVYDQVADLSVIYGSITVVLVFLYSVYLYASAFLFGAEFASAWGLPPGTGPGEPLTTQLKRAALGLFVRQRPPEPPATR
jgi:membrane protein